MGNVKPNVYTKNFFTDSCAESGQTNLLISIEAVVHFTGT
jgi:hypothetical protein